MKPSSASALFIIILVSGCADNRPIRLTCTGQVDESGTVKMSGVGLPPRERSSGAISFDIDPKAGNVLVEEKGGVAAVNICGPVTDPCEIKISRGHIEVSNYDSGSANSQSNALSVDRATGKGRYVTDLGSLASSWSLTCQEAQSGKS